NNARIAELIQDGEIDGIPAAIEDGDFFKMQTFTQALIDLVMGNQVERDAAVAAATNRHDFLVALDRATKQRAAEERAAAEEAGRAQEDGLRWGTDANGDGIADPWNPVDALYSAARYLAASGAPGDMRRAVFAYNHATWYVDDVLSLAQLYGGSPADAAPQPVFTLDKLQSRLNAAQAKVAKAS